MSRPTHPDFTSIAAGVSLNDFAAAERSIQEIVSEMADYESVQHVAIERSKMAVFEDNPMLAVLFAMRQPEAMMIVASMAANWIDGFAAGVKFSNSRPPASSRAMANRVPEALALIEKTLYDESSQGHLYWFLDQLAKILAGPQYEIWRDGAADRHGGEYVEGIAP